MKITLSTILIILTLNTNSQNISFIDTVYIFRNKFKLLEKFGIASNDLGILIDSNRVFLVEEGNIKAVDSNQSKKIESIFLNFSKIYIITLYKGIKKIEEGYWGSEMLDGGTYKNYYKNGTLHSTGKYINGHKSGEWVIYRRNGRIKRRVFFKNTT